MFKVGIYKSQLICINVLLLIVIGLMVFDRFNEPKQETTPTVQQVAPTFLPVSRIENTPTDMEIQRAMGDYQLEVTERYFMLYDGDRLVHVFDRNRNPNCDIFRVVDRDNL